MCSVGEAFDNWEEMICEVDLACTCLECGRILPQGERALFATYTDHDGDEGSYVSCLHCHAIADWLVSKCESFPVGSVIDEAFEHALDEDYIYDYEVTVTLWERLAVARVIRDAKKQWRGRDGQLLPVPSLRYQYLPPSERSAAREEDRAKGGSWKAWP